MKIKVLITTLIILFTFSSIACGRTAVQIDDLGLITGPAGFGRLTTLAQVVAAVAVVGTDITVIVNREITAITQGVPITVQLKFVGEGTLNVGIVQTVTFAETTTQIIAGTKQHIFTGAGAVIFALGGTVWPDWWEYNVQDVTNMSIALQAAIDSINVPNGGHVRYNGGIYIIEEVRTYSNIAHHGVYGATILKRSDVVDPAAVSYILHVNGHAGGSADPADNATNILIEDITFHGNSDTLGFIESHHSLVFAATSDAIVQRNSFIFTQGDGFFIGCGFHVGERHSYRIKLLYNYFDHWDGTQRGGRNAITLAAGVSILIKGNTIMRTGTAGMPGGIDVESDGNAYTRMQDITIEENYFGDNTRAGIQIYLNNADSYTLPPRDFKILNNYFASSNAFTTTPIYVRLFNNGAPYLVTAADAPHGVLIKGNHIDDTGGVISITGTKGTIITENIFYITSSLGLGSVTSNIGENNYDMIVDNNIFDRSGNSDGQIIVGNINNLKITNNTFRDPNDSGAGQRCIAFMGDGIVTTSTNVTISGNSFVGTLLATVYVISHTLDPQTNRYFANHVDELLTIVNYFVFNSSENTIGFGIYDVAADGGIFNAEYMLGMIPNNARIIRAWYQIVENFASLGLATVQIGINTDAVQGIQVQQAFDHADYLIGYHDGVPDGMVANMTTQTTAVNRFVMVAIDTADVTAGRIIVWWEYIIGE